MRIEKDMTVNAPIGKVYTIWSDFENFPTFMKHVQSVTKTGDKTYHWKAQIGPVKKEWDAHVQGLSPNKSVTWRSVSGADNAGAVTLSERGSITEVHVVIEYDPTWFETLGDAVTKSASRSVEEDLERFKRQAEGNDPDKANTGTEPAMGQHGTGSNDSVTYSRQD